MFIPFIAASAIAAMFIKLGAMSVWVSVLSVGLKAMTVLVLALVLYAIRTRRSAR